MCFRENRRNNLHELKWNGRTLRFGVFENGGIILALGKDTEETSETLAQLGSAYLLALPLVVIAVGIGSWWIAQRAVAPVKAIAARAEKISASDLHQRLPESSAQEEIAHLTRVLNAMFDRLQRSFEQVTRFTSDASHELKMPLASCARKSEMAIESSDLAPAQRELLSDLIEQCTQLSQIVDGLLFLSRADDHRLALEQTSVDLVAMVRELIEDAEILAAQSTVSLECKLPAELVVPGDLRLLRRAVMNLIDNAIKYNIPGGSVILSASLKERTLSSVLATRGSASQPESRDRIFHRFYRSDLPHNQANRRPWTGPEHRARNRARSRRRCHARKIGFALDRVLARFAEEGRVSPAWQK